MANIPNEPIDIDHGKQNKFNSIIEHKASKNHDDYFATVIDLSSNPKPVGDKAMQMIANFLKLYCGVIYTITIVLDNCGITDRGVGILCHTLFEIYKDNPLKIEIRSISLQNNPITTKGIDYIMSILRRGETFYEGYIDGKEQLYNYSIDKINLCGIQMSPEDNDKYYNILKKYYIDCAIHKYGKEQVYSDYGIPEAGYMELITPKMNFTSIYIDWEDMIYV
jgi:hypothetical protein